MPVLPLLLAMLAAGSDLVDAAGRDSRWVLDIRYATPDNFTGKQLYAEARCLLLPLAADKLVKAQAYLDQHHVGYRLMLKDCYRPAHVQLVMWEAVKGTPMRRYVASPKSGSIHSYGAAVDLTLADAGGNEVDMGTPYDCLGELAEPRHEERLLGEGKLTAAQVANRCLLRDAMVKGGGFVSIRNEWWHFEALPGKEIRQRFERLDVPLTATAEAAVP